MYEEDKVEREIQPINPPAQHTHASNKASVCRPTLRRAKMIAVIPQNADSHTHKFVQNGALCMEVYTRMRRGHVVVPCRVLSAPGLQHFDEGSKYTQRMMHETWGKM